MYIARILYPVKVLGPGNRVGIWFAGCEHHCKGCSNPELWDFNKRYKTSINVVENLLEKVAQDYIIDGFTLTGGDPFFQPEALKDLLPVLKNYADDILVYTGYDYVEVKDKYPDLLNTVTVLIDGKYIEELNNATPLKGSENQNIIIIDEKYKEFYELYLKNVENKIQNFMLLDGVVSVGIHKPGYEKVLDNILMKKGLNKNE